MTDFSTIVLIGIIFSIAAMMHGLCGFGFSLLSVGLLSLLIGPKTAIPLDIVAASANCFYLAWLLRKEIIFRETLVIIIISILFVPLGTFYLSKFNSTVIIRSMGIIILLVSLTSVLKKEYSKIFSAKYFKWFAGAASGLLGGAFNIPGPPLVLYSYNSHWPLRNAMANLQLIFSVMTIVIVLSFSSAGLFNLKIVATGAAYIPFVALFTFVGSRISKRLELKYLSIVINVFLLCLGATLLIKG